MEGDHQQGILRLFILAKTRFNSLSDGTQASFTYNMKLRHVLTLLCLSLSDFFFDINFLFCSSWAVSPRKVTTEKEEMQVKRVPHSFTFTLSHMYPFHQYIVIFPASQTPFLLPRSLSLSTIETLSSKHPLVKKTSEYVSTYSHPEQPHLYYSNRHP